MNGPELPKKKRRKKSDSQRLKDTLDAIFSKYIRLRDNREGCFTCGHNPGWKKLQNGHFVPRQYLETRFDERNCHAQCYACNMFYGGQPATYAKRLQDKYGQGVVEELERGRWVTVKDFPYQEKIDHYTQEVDIMLKKLSEM